MYFPFKSELSALMLFALIMTSSLTAGAQNEPFKPSGKVTGTVFGDYAYKIHADSLAAKRGNTQYAGQKKDWNAFDIRRFYLGYEYNFTPRFTAEAVLAHETGDSLPDLNRSFYLKYANLRWKQIFKGTDLILGQQRTPAFATPNGSEQIWAYRPLEKTLLDQRKIAGSTDLGISLQGKYNDGQFGYDLLVGNNNGAKFASSPSKRVYADVYARFFKKTLEVQLYGDYFQANKGSYLQANTVYKVFVAYTHPWFTVGAEGFQQMKGKAIKNADGSFTDVAPTGFSVFARGSILKDTAKRDVITAFVRYDSYDPNFNIPAGKAVAKDAAIEWFATAGIDYMPIKTIHIMPNIWYNAYRTKTNANVKDKSDYDLVARLTLSYNF